MSRLAVTVLLYAGYAVTTSAGLLLVKYWLPAARLAWREGDAWSRPMLSVGAGALLYVLSFGLWLLIVERLPLSIAFPTAIGVSMIAIALGSVLVLSEGIGWGQIIGMLLILAGIALVARGPGAG